MLVYPPQQSILPYYVGASHQFDMSHPYCYLGNSSPFQQFDNEIYPQNMGRHVRLMPIGVSAHPMAAFSGFYESHEPPPLGYERSIVSAHRHGHRTASKVDTFYIVVLLLSPWRPSGRYGASSRPMAASSGFRRSPGHAESGDALRIASMRLHGHRNGPRWRYICSPLLHFLIAVIIA